MILNNKLTISVTAEGDTSCMIDWCDHEAHYRVLAECNGGPDLAADFCARHLQSMIQVIVDASEQAWSDGRFPEVRA